ncbi:tyrosine-type recombinase/integrase [Holdemania filiformis]|uniref:tyrosine-type recombinase/integrase n=1 Tax=Holdemania filiformis TaxID=61171 RepID=UPI00210EA111|nr:tyrosine-type recombinase/integrase [Holdemania filiformis]MCQ4952139.1 tyrosine-type recombinase/integrase [Holdemania filiformis]
MKNDVINLIILKLNDKIESREIELVKNTLITCLEDYDLVPKKNEVVPYGYEDEKLIQLFLVSKKIDGLSDRSIKAYRQELNSHLHLYIKKKITDITTDDLRMHFAKRMIDSPSLSKATLNGERRYLSSFFTWLADNGYIPRNPMRAIKKMKEDKRIKKPFTQEEIELMRDELKNRVEKARNNRDRFVAIRMQALFEFMLSTGCRVSEASGAKLKDLNMTSNEILVFGKGAKERVCYLNEISIIRLKQWLEVRSEMSVDSEYLFTGYQNSYTDETQLGAGSIESYFRHLGNQLGIKCHPHKFRRTCATMALTKGMPIEEVQQMLGHNEINTTMIYAQVSQENVKHSHRKYM